VLDKHGTQYDFYKATSRSDGVLKKITDRNGNTLTYHYDANNNIDTITDSFGRVMSIGYANGKIDTVIAGDRTVHYHYDKETGDLDKVTFPDNSYVTYTYSNHKMTAATDNADHVIESHHYTDGVVDETQSDSGNYFYSFDRADPEHPTVTNARNITTEYTVDPLRGVATDRSEGPGCPTCGGPGDELHKTYHAYLNVTDIVDGVGTRTHMTYDGKGNVLTRTENCGALVNGVCANTQATPPTARVTSYTYNSFNFPLTITLPTATPGSCSNANRVTTNVYSTKGNLTSTQVTGCNDDEPFSYTTSYSYFEATGEHGQLHTVTSPRTDVTATTTFEYFPDDDTNVNNAGRLKRVTNALDKHTDFAGYDVFGNVGTLTDPNGVQTAYQYDARDRVKEIRIRATPGENSADNGADIITRYDYDSVGRREFVKLPNCVYLGCDFSFKYVYDNVNRVKEIHDAVGNKVIYTYDLAGNRTREEYKESSSATKHDANFEYDDFNRLERVCHEPTNATTCGSVYDEYSYYEDGLLEAVRDPMSHTTGFEYDGLKRLKKSTEHLGTTPVETSYDYDRVDGLKQLTDPGGLITTYKNNDLGWRLKTVSPDTGTTTYGYDPAGNLTTSHNANDITVARNYDALDRLTTVNYPGTSLDVTYSYDATSVSNGKGRRTGMVDASRSSTFAYDTRGLLTQEQRTIGGQTFLTDYSFDKTGNLTEIAYPAFGSSSQRGKAIYHYDDADRVDLVEASVNGAVQTVADTFTYNPFGPRTHMTFGSTLQDTRTYDNRYRLKDWTLGSLLDYTHSYDSDNNLTGRVDHKVTDNSSDRTYGYDSLHRLITATGPWTEASTCSGSATYTYDANGNRTCKGEFGTSTTYSYVSGKNRLNSETVGATTHTYSYDSNGNTTGDGTHTYQYSDADRLASVDSGSAATYLYDGDNRRAQKTVGSTNTYYFYDPSGRLLQEYTPSTGVGIDYLYAQDAPIARIDWTVTESTIGEVLSAYKSGSNVHLDWSAYAPTGDSYVVRRKQVTDPDENTFNGAFAIATVDYPTETYNDPVVGSGNRYDYRVFKRAKSDSLFYYHTDHLGTPIALTSGSSTFVWKAEYLPFGGTSSVSGPSGFNNLRFPGQYFDEETGLHQNGWRYYSEGLGRYLAADPIQSASGQDIYAYALSNPIAYTDPLGLAVLINDMTNGQLTFIRTPELPNAPSIVITATTNVVRSADPGSQNGFVTYDVNQLFGAEPRPYGSSGAYLDTGDRRGRDIHGGGSSLPNPTDFWQPLTPTYGCSRGHNADVTTLGDEITQFKETTGGARILYLRVGTPPGATKQDYTIPLEHPFVRAILDGRLQVRLIP
jgi:RHS repeat-associated protein